MDYEYKTYEAASNAVDAAIGDAVADNPEIGGDDVAHDMVLAIADFCEPSVASELKRRWLGL